MPKNDFRRILCQNIIKIDFTVLVIYPKFLKNLFFFHYLCIFGIFDTPKTKD